MPEQCLPLVCSPEDAGLAQQLTRGSFPRSAAYNPRWLLENLMGPNVLWLTEALAERMDLKPGMRVLDIGCGKALSSIFLAHEFGVQVWATDLWIGATDNWRRIQEAGLGDRVFPIHSDAHSLPYTDDFFDAVVSLDAFHYFATGDDYLAPFVRLVREGGQIGILSPGLRTEFESGVPDHLRPYWEDDFSSFHSPDWWRSHFERTGAVEVQTSELLTDGWKHWFHWNEVCREHGYVPEQFEEVVVKEGEMLRTDAGQNVGFTLLLARRLWG